MTGFSRGGYVTWRLMCEHADRFASIAPGAGGSAPGGDCMGVDEVSCPFDASMPGGMPSRAVPVLALMGRLDEAVPLACTTRIRDQAIAAWGLGAAQILDGDAGYTHNHWGPADAAPALLETFEHSYETRRPRARVVVRGPLHSRQHTRSAGAAVRGRLRAAQRLHLGRSR